MTYLCNVFLSEQRRFLLLRLGLSGMIAGVMSDEPPQRPDEPRSDKPEKIKRIKNLGEWWDRHPLKIITALVALAVTVTFRVVRYIDDSELKLTQRTDAVALDKEKTDLESTIRDLKFRLTSIERHLGEKSFWDLSTLMVPPDQIKNLDHNIYVYHDDICCYLSVPESPSWEFVKTTANGLQMLFSNTTKSPYSNKLLNGTDPLLESAKTRTIYLWKGPGSFDINTTDVETPILHVFPHVTIEAFDNRRYAEMITAVAQELKRELEATNAAFKGLSQLLKNLVHKLNGNNDPGHQDAPSGTSETNLDAPFEKMMSSILTNLQSSSPPTNSDASTFWAMQEL